MDAGEEIIGKKRLEAELDVEVLVLLFGFNHAADDEDGDAGLELAEVPDELRAGHAGHDVVGNDEIDGGGILVLAELLKSALRTENGDDMVSDPLEDGLPRCRLDCVVVDEQDSGRHSILTVESLCAPAQLFSAGFFLYELGEMLLRRERLSIPSSNDMKSICRTVDNICTSLSERMGRYRLR